MLNRVVRAGAKAPLKRSQTLARGNLPKQATRTVFETGDGGLSAKPPKRQPKETALMNVDGMRQQPGPNVWGAGEPHLAQRPIDDAEKVPLTKDTVKSEAQGIVSTKTGPLKMTNGVTYIYLIDPERGLTYVKEKELILQDEGTRSGGKTHPLIVEPKTEKASIGGEMKLTKQGTLQFNTRSGRYSKGVTDQQKVEVAKLFGNLRKDELGAPLRVEFMYDIQDDRMAAMEELNKKGQMGKVQELVKKGRIEDVDKLLINLPQDGGDKL